MVTEKSTKINDHDYKTQYEEQYRKQLIFGGKELDIYCESLVEIKRFDCNVNWSIIDRPERYFEPDWFIKDHYLELLQLHRNNYIRNQDCLRLAHTQYNDTTNTVEVWLSRVKCFDHLVTNLVMDYQLTQDVSLRSYYESAETMTSLQHSKMANALGINALVFLNDGTLLLPLSGNNASVSKNMITASLAFGCFCDEKYAQSGSHLFEDYILHELETPLFFDGRHLQQCNMTILFLGLGRDVSWGETPFILFY